MWSAVAVTLGVATMLVGLARGKLGEPPLSGSPRATALALACGLLLGTAALLTVLGLTSWSWTGPVMAVPFAVALIRLLIRALSEGELRLDPHDDLRHRYGPRL
jgi:hypothetical protein